MNCGNPDIQAIRPVIQGIAGTGSCKGFYEGIDGDGFMRSGVGDIGMFGDVLSADDTGKIRPARTAS